ncbi:ribosome silencing factor [candidate division KSB1 bacterium]
MTSKKLAETIARLTLNKQAEDVLILDLRKITTLTDFFVICSGGTEIHLKAITDAVLDGLVEYKIKPWHKEGIGNKTWILLDFVDVVLHIFNSETRDFYQLERLWGDAPVTSVNDNTNTEE